jgi:hypothetical protein
VRKLPLILGGQSHQFLNPVVVGNFLRETMASRDLHQKIGRSTPRLIRHRRHAEILDNVVVAVGPVPDIASGRNPRGVRAFSPKLEKCDDRAAADPDGKRYSDRLGLP